MSTHQHAGHTHQPAGTDPPAFHGMILWGANSVYLSHLAMIRHPIHAYQIIVEAGLTRDGLVSDVYLDDRKKNPEQELYSFVPEDFVLPDILPDGAAPPQRTSFTGALFRGHFEKGGEQIAPDLVADIKRVVHGRKLEVDPPTPKTLEYIVFGTSDEVYLAHLITRPPDFDQVIQVKLDHQIPEEELGRGLRLTVPGRINEKGKRIQQRDGTVAATLHSAGGEEISVEIEPGGEVHFNDDRDLQ
ncbi:hypothetical protein [Rhodococcus koreensis]